MIYKDILLLIYLTLIAIKTNLKQNSILHYKKTKLSRKLHFFIVVNFIYLHLFQTNNCKRILKIYSQIDRKIM